MIVARGWLLVLVIAAALAAAPLAQEPRRRRAAAAPDPKDDARIEKLKAEAVADVEAMKVFTQQMVDSIFSFGELGFQESRDPPLPGRHPEEERLHGRGGHRRHPDRVHGDAGAPGKPVIALGSDIDGIPQASQKPGVAYHDPLIEGAPGHGEGHNSGQPVNITAAIAVKKIMEREKLPGTIRIWPGTAEELVGTKAYFVRAGLLQGRRRRALHARRQRAWRCRWGDRGRHRPGVGRVHVPRRDRAFRRRAVARPQRARRGRADEHRLELPARAPAARAPLALRHHRRRRSAERRAAHRLGLVLLPADHVSEDQGAVGDRRRRSPRARR